MDRVQPRAIIRPATPADAAGVARVHVDSWRTTYRGIIPGDHLAKLSYEKREQGFARWLEQLPVVCVAEQAAKIVGFATGGSNLEDSDPAYRSQLYAIYILQEYQRHGIGRQLIGYVANGLMMLGMPSMLIWVLAANTNARCFYESLGGRPVRTKVIEIGGAKLEETAYGWTDVTPLLRLCAPHNS